MKALIPSVQEWLYFSQQEALAYYKKCYRSDGIYPPLSYYIEVLGGPLRRNPRPDVVAAFNVSADLIVSVSCKPMRAGQDTGVYFAMGRGWIYPERNSDAFRLILSPGRTLSFRFICGPNSAVIREVAAIRR